MPPPGREPAETASTTSPWKAFARASAIWLRATLPVQRKRIFFFNTSRFRTDALIDDARGPDGAIGRSPAALLAETGDGVAVQRITIILLPEGVDGCRHVGVARRRRQDAMAAAAREARRT